jgi:hypothetical protein
LLISFDYPMTLDLRRATEHWAEAAQQQMQQ